MDVKMMHLLAPLFKVLNQDVLKALAIQTGFIQRERAFNATQFLYLLFSKKSEIVSDSLEQLCVALTEQDVWITKSALNKRFDERSVLFVQAIFERLFEVQLQLTMPKLTGYRFARIRILDGTTIKLPDAYEGRFQGIHCASVKVQVEFDYLTQQLLYFKLMNGRAADQPTGMDRLGCIKEDELILQDLGYYQLDLFREIEKRGAYYVTKAKRDVQLFVEVPDPPKHPDGTYIESRRYQRVHLEAIAIDMERGAYKEWPTMFVGRHEKLPVRCIVYCLTEEQEKEMRKKEQRRRQKKQGAEHKKQVADLQCVTIYLTNLSMEVPKEEIHELYRLRWQIELLFKRWKSDLGVHSIKNVKIERWLCHFYTECIILLLSEILMGMIRNEARQKQDVKISERKAVRTIAKKINQLLEGIWTSKRQLYRYFDTLTQNVLSFCLKDTKRKPS